MDAKIDKSERRIVNGVEVVIDYYTNGAIAQNPVEQPDEASDDADDDRGRNPHPDRCGGIGMGCSACNAEAEAQDDDAFGRWGR